MVPSNSSYSVLLYKEIEHNAGTYSQVLAVTGQSWRKQWQSEAPCSVALPDRLIKELGIIPGSVLMAHLLDCARNRMWRARNCLLFWAQLLQQASTLLSACLSLAFIENSMRKWKRSFHLNIKLSICNTYVCVYVYMGSSCFRYRLSTLAVVS